MSTPENIDVKSLSAFLRDLDWLYQIVRFSTDPKYATIGPQWPLLEGEDRLLLRRVSFNSPLLVEVILPIAVGSATVVWIFLQAIEKIVMLPLHRRKLQLEIEQLQKNLGYADGSITVGQAEAAFAHELDRKGLRNRYSTIIHRLQRSPIQIDEADFDAEVLERLSR